jgi:putative oxidoreductase
MSNGGYEYNLVLIGALLLIVDGGPGDLSIDHFLGTEETGPGTALAALALGVAGSSLAIAAGAKAAPTADPAPTPAPVSN